MIFDTPTTRAAESSRYSHSHASMSIAKKGIRSRVTSGAHRLMVADPAVEAATGRIPPWVLLRTILPPTTDHPARLLGRGVGRRVYFPIAWLNGQSVT